MGIVRNNTFNNEVLFIDGHPSSGKALFSKVMEGFEGVEISGESELFSILQRLYRLGKIDRESVITLFKVYADRCIYNQMIGRNINSRLGDFTCIHKYPHPEKYYIRMESTDEHSKITENISKEKPIFQNMTQNILAEGHELFEAFGDRLKILYINRNHSDIVDGIVKCGFGERIGTDPTEITLSIDYNEHSIPYYAEDWGDEYLKMTPKDRVSRWVKQETILVGRAYRTLPNRYKGNIMFIDFEKFVKYPYEYCNDISKFIGRRQTNKLKDIIKTEGCPR